MFSEAILGYARDKGLTPQDAAQAFLQFVVLRHLSDRKAVFMGGTALVLGYGNPRFSEDVDLTQVDTPESLRPGLVKTRAEVETWFGAPTTMMAPKATNRTWRLTIRLGRAESLSVHVDSQPYKALTTRPIVVAYPSYQPIVIPTLSLEEIMAEKVLALAGRNYLSGRDLFDLWFHWLRTSDWEKDSDRIRNFVQRKIKERHLKIDLLRRELARRLSPEASLSRARQEWTRYLPAEFQKDSVYSEITERCRVLRRVLS